MHIVRTFDLRSRFCPHAVRANAQVCECMYTYPSVCARMRTFARVGPGLTDPIESCAYLTLSNRRYDDGIDAMTMELTL
jgi:hypothetical protein